MSTIANAKVEHNYNRYNGYFFGCLPVLIECIYKVSANPLLRLALTFTLLGI